MVNKLLLQLTNSPWGLLLVVAASVSEKAGAKLLLPKVHSTKWLMKLCNRMKLVWADGGYQGDDLANWVTKLLT